MTDEAMNVAIAEACGIKVCNHPMKFGGPPCCDGVARPRKYAADLNAMREACDTALTTDELRRRYVMELDHIINCAVMPDPTDAAFDMRDFIRDGVYRLCNATARQRAEAFLRTVGRWTEVPT